MKNRVLLLLMIMLCVASLCMGCATENITPNENKNTDTNPQPKEEKVEYTLGEYFAVDFEGYAESETKPLVLYINTMEECIAAIDHDFMSYIEKNFDEFPEVLQKRYTGTKKYTEEFFEEKKLIVVAWAEKISGGGCKFELKDFVCVTEEGKTPSYRIMTEYNDNMGGADAEGSFSEIIVFEIDRVLDIHSENLIVEVMKTK